MNVYKPMLLASREQPFDDPAYIFEIKFDGVRCIANLDGKTVLTGRSGRDFTPLFPELKDMHIFVGKSCVLDGELVVFTDDAPDFSRILSRTSGGANSFNAAKTATPSTPANPAVFIAFDILELGEKPLVGLPLVKRKALLSQVLPEKKSTSDASYNSLTSRPVFNCPFVDGAGKKLFDFAAERKLEGIVAKRKDGLYHCGKRTDDWVKIKPLKREEFVVFGYLAEDGADKVRDLILGDYKNGRAVFKTKIYAGHKNAETKTVREFLRDNRVFSPPFAGFPSAVWLKPLLVCTVEYLETTKNGLRHPVLKSLHMRT